MNDLASFLGLRSFSDVLSAYSKTAFGISFDAVDGGAGSGSTSREIASFLPDGKQVYAFEPFQGNHRFFNKEEHKIILCTEALSCVKKRMLFRVPSVVTSDSHWGRQGMTGYSSVGYLIEDTEAQGEGVYAVDADLGDNLIPTGREIGFVKLDLQGGELSALKGMTRVLKTTRLAWIEFTNQDGLLDFLAEQNFMIHDTEYLFDGYPSNDLLDDFNITNPCLPLSTGKSAWLGFRTKPWINYEARFKYYQSSYGLIQTDLLCVNRRYLDEFTSAIPFLVNHSQK